MQIRAKQYKDNIYLEYKHKENNRNKMIFTNAEYFTIDINSEEYKKIMAQTGGFVANMTSRHIKRNQLNCSYIMLCCIPQEYNDYLFCFLYLDNNRNIVDYMSDNNPYDFEYFKNKFNSCIIETGMVYDLVKNDSFSKITEQFSHISSPQFSLVINGRNLDWNDIIFDSNKITLSLFSDKIRNAIQLNNGAHVLLKSEFNVFNGFCLKGSVLNNKGEYIPSYKIDYGVCNEDEYIQKWKKEHSDVTNIEKIKKQIDISPFQFTLHTEQIEMMTDQLLIYKQQDIDHLIYDEIYREDIELE